MPTRPRCRSFGYVQDRGSWEAPWRRERRAARADHRPPWRRHKTPYREWPVGERTRRGWPGLAVLAGLIQMLGTKRVLDPVLLQHALDSFSYALVLIGPVALLWRRRAPLAVLVVATLAAIGFAVLVAPRFPLAVAAAFALFNLAKHGRRTAALLTASAAYLGYVLLTGIFAGQLGVSAAARLDSRVALALPLGAAFLIFMGGAAKVRSEHLDEMMKARAERARAVQEQQKRQASEERLRIARELHDVLGHHLSLINVQAGVGLHLMDNRPEQAREALSAIKTASAEALREVRSVLGVLRNSDEQAPRQPAPGLSRLAELTADAGFPVATEISGDAGELPAAVDRAAYRIVQEALTNVRKHGGSAARATVAIGYTPAELRLTISSADSGPADLGPADLAVVHEQVTVVDAPQQQGGSGIAGMRARALSLGGTLVAGPVMDGFVVSALLPLSVKENT